MPYHDADQIEYNSDNGRARRAQNYSIHKPVERDRAIQRLIVLLQMNLTSVRR